MSYLERIQVKVADSMLREQEMKESTAEETLAAMSEARETGAATSKEILRKAVVERETAEMIQRAMSEGIAKARNPVKEWS